MTLVSSSSVEVVDGVEQMRAFVVANQTPATLPTDGTGVDGMRDNVHFAPFSILYVVTGGDVYIAGEDGVFVKQ